MNIAELTIAPRFCGPPDSGNGGYVAGLFANYAAAPVAVRLLRPLPLGVPLGLSRGGEDGLELRQGERLLAEATCTEFELQVPATPSFAAASEAALRYAGRDQHPSPQCFVCGPGRSPGDGLRLATGTLDGDDPSGLFAAPWVPAPSLAGTRGAVRPEFLAAALDCPGYFAVSTDARMRLLGLMTLRIDGTIAVGERAVVVAWSLGGQGRKRRAATAVYAASGACVARAISTWIELKSG